MNLTDAFKAFAAEKGITSAQLALAWVLHQGENIIPIPGTRKIARLEENSKAVDVVLTKEDLKAIDAIIAKYPNVGNRYNEGAMKLVNN